MTNAFGRLRAALSCGAATSALATGALSMGALAQDGLVIEDVRTAPVATSEVGDVTVAADGAIRIAAPEGPAILLDSDADVTVAEDGTDGGDGFEIDLGPEGVSDAEGLAGIAVRGGVTGTVSVGGDVRVLSSLERQEDAPPPAFPEGRFGLLIEQDARLTGDVTFAESASIAVQSAGGAGVGVLGALDGNLTVGASIGADGDGAAGVRIAGPVSGDVLIGGAETGRAIRATGRDATGIDVGGDVGGTLTVARGVQSSVFTDVDGLPDLPEGQTGLTVGQQDAQVGGSALRVTGDVAGGIEIARARATVTGTDDAPGVEGRTAGTLAVDGAAPALSLDGGAVIGALSADDDAGERGFAGFGLYNGGLVTSAVSRGDVDAVALYVGDASVEGGLFNDLASGAGIEARATGDGASAVAVFLDEDANLGRVVNAGRILAEASTDTGTATAILDRSGTLTQIVNTGSIGAAVTDFTGRSRDADGEPDFERNDDGTFRLVNGERVELFDSDPTQALAFAIDLAANASGVVVENRRTINGAVRLGSGDDQLVVDGSDGTAQLFATLAGTVDTGDGDDALTVTGGGVVGFPTQGGSVFPTVVDLGEGRDAITVTGANSALVALVDFGGGDGGGDDDDGDGGTLSVLDGGRFFGTLSNASGVDVVMDGEGSEIELLSDVTEVASLTTRGGTLVFDVAEDGQTVSGLTVLGDVDVDEATRFRTVFGAAFSEIAPTAILTAGGDLDIDLDVDRLQAAGAAPFLFSQSLDLSEDGQSIVLTLDRKTADEIGLAPDVAPAYEPLIAALVAANEDTLDEDGNANDDADVAVGAALFNLGGVGTNEDVEFITAETRFFEAFDQFLPAPLDAPLTYARVQTNAVTSLVTQRVTGLRDGSDGRRNAWLQESSYFVRREEDGAERGFDGGGFAIALGLDAPLGPIDTVGLSAAVASARYDEEGGEDFPYDRLTYSFGAYAADRIGKVHLDGHVSYGWASSESERNLVVTDLDEATAQATGEGDVRRTARGEWDGTQLSAHGRVLYAGQMGGWDVQPFASLDYLDLREDAYAETGTDVRAFALEVDEREATSLRGNAGLIVGREFKTRPSRFDTGIPATIAPRLTLAYTDELDGGDLTGTYNFERGEDFTLTQEKPGGAGILGADVVYENEYARLGLGGSLTASEEVQFFTLRVGVGLAW